MSITEVLLQHTWIVIETTVSQVTENIYLGYILRGPKHILLRPFLSERLKEDQIADNIYDSAMLRTGATSYTLPLYSNMQKRARFALCISTCTPTHYIECMTL
jgi:hypothetical protein